MASKTQAAANGGGKEGEESSDSPLLDSMNAAVKKLVAKGKDRGYVTYDEVNNALPSEEMSSERIEDGREMMIGGLCESPLTIQALLAWHDALLEGKMLLRDIIDLDATYG